MRSPPSIFAFHTRFQWASVTALALAALSLLVLVWQSARTSNHVRDVQAVLVRLERVQSDLIDLETGVRGYVITGNPRFLQPYRAARGRVMPDVTRLEQLATRTVPGFHARGELRALTVQWLDLGAREVVARQDSAPRAAALVATGRSKSVMDALRAALTNDRAQVGRELTRSAGVAQAVTVGGLCTAALLLIATLALLLAGRRLNLAMRGVLVDATAAAEAFGVGDQSVRMPHSAYREGETLSSAFNGMAERLEGLVHELQAANARLERSNRELDQFAFVASHDLKTPLRTLTSFSELLERRLGTSADPRTQRDLRFIAQASRRMNEQVDDLLGYARVQQADLKLVAVDLHAVAREAAERLQEQLSEADATVHVEALPRVVGDPGLLRRVFEQLMSNAITHRRAGQPPRVQVTASADARWCTVHITDDGPGIPAAYRDQAFRLFQRVHPGGGPEGSGVGLALCRQVIERHGGRIWLQDAPGGSGLTVAFTLPLP